MPYFSKFWKIEVRDEIAKEWTDARGQVDDMMAGLHEIQERITEEQYDIQELEKRQKEIGKLSHQDFIECSKTGAAKIR